MWTYTGIKDPNLSILTFPDSQFLASRWHKVGGSSSADSEPELWHKHKHATWRGSGTRYIPMKNLYDQGHLENNNQTVADLAFLNHVKSATTLCAATAGRAMSRPILVAIHGQSTHPQSHLDCAGR